jgi:hypothetical protein
MIDMSKLYSHSDYTTTLATFDSTPNNGNTWSVFQPVHLKVTINRCPICECPLDGSIIRTSNNGSTTLTPTIDHYRPKAINLYPLLKYDHENYILMCSDCNSAYKKCKFPLHSSTPNRNITATSTSNISNEKPLITNPIYDVPNDIFKIVFRLSMSGKKVLELEPKQTDTYLKEKAEETIKLFSLGNCEAPTHIHSNPNVQNCRVNLLHSHFNKFYSIIKILNGKNILELGRADQLKIFKEVQEKKLKEYGFYSSIMRNNYSNLIP